MDNQQRRIINYTIRTKRGTINDIYINSDYATIEVRKDNLLIGLVKLDIDDLDKIGRGIVLRGGYARTSGRDGQPLHHAVMGHTSNMQTVVDHINSDRLDNRKSNLRVVTYSENANNRNRSSLNNTGVVGISRRKHNKYNYEYFRAVVSDRTTPMQGAPSKTKQFSKQFNINSLGEALAFEMAKKWLEEKRREFGYLSKSN